ncbi:MAG: DUF3553 domain-containing protein [Litoreibacter sp.]|uniref:DUF3553 domain-containing protein n=1 Tax=Litoreibacter sp. TaxID=1969459 RepID=UPI003297CF80
MREANSEVASFRVSCWKSLSATLERALSDNMNSLLEPGMLVRNPAEPEWGLGQVQSNINGKLTVNFENMGKMTLESAKITLLQERNV